MERIGKDEYFMSIAELIGKRSTCLKRKFGAIVVRDNRILTSGYNGAPKGLKHCDEVGCGRKDEKPGEGYALCRGVHAEQNAIIQGAISGVNIKNGTLYVNGFPCVQCTRMIINSEIKRLVYKEKADRNKDMQLSLLDEADIEIKKMG